MTNCPNCGAPIKEGRRSCEYCGTMYHHDDESRIAELMYQNAQMAQAMSIHDAIQVQMQESCCCVNRLSFEDRMEIARRVADGGKVFL